MSEAEPVSSQPDRVERSAVLSPGQLTPTPVPLETADLGLISPNAVTKPRQPSAGATTRQILRWQRTRGNQFVQRAVSANEQRIQRQQRPEEASASVPGLPRDAASQIESNLGGNRQNALDVLTKALSDRGDISLSFLTGEKMTSVADTTRMAPGHYGLTSLSPGTGRPRPCRVEIGPDAFRTVGDLYATVMHEWLHVLQFRRPAAASEAADELEARLWEVENLERTGLWRDARYMGRIRGDLDGWWDRLTPAEQGRYQNRYDAARQLITTMTSRLEDEQFRQQQGVRRSLNSEVSSEADGSSTPRYQIGGVRAVQNQPDWPRMEQRVAEQVLPMRQRSPNPIQRQEEPEPEPAADAEATALNQELEQLLDQIRGTPVPPFEAITGTTAGEYSRGELEQAVQRLWRRERLSFTSAARQVAREGSGRARDPRAAQSQPIAATTPYARRWTVNLFAADYQTWSDLPEIANLYRRGSPFQQTLAAEFERVTPVVNPTTGAMRSAIMDAIIDLSASVPYGQYGELVVTFSGHGGNGKINGVDGGVLLPMDLQRLAEFAGEWDVHVIYILDTCRAGQLVAFAQAAAVRDIGGRIQDLPASERGGPQALIELARRLGSHSATINHKTIALGDAQRAHRRRRTDTNQAALLQAFSDFSRSFTEIKDEVREMSAGNAVPPQVAAQLGELQVQLLVMNTYTFATLATGVRNVNDDLRQAAVVLDTLYNVVNRIIELANEATTTQPPEPAAAGAGEGAMP